MAGKSTLPFLAAAGIAAVALTRGKKKKKKKKEVDEEEEMASPSAVSIH